MKAFVCDDGGGTRPPPAHYPEPEAFTRHYFQPPTHTRFYAGVDLHARSLYLAVLDRDGTVLLCRNLPAQPEPFLKAIAPFRECVSGPARASSLAQPPGPAGPSRPSPYECWVRLVRACR
jgi:hypothetical protein